MPELRDEKLDFWIKHGLNVLLIGPHGVGKTTRVKDAFDRNKLRYKYYSAATMDPWVDFVGIPKEAKDEKGSYLELILPKELRDDNIDALFFDEFNRSHKKVRNAVMELIQFRSINGRKLHNLKMVWAAINPEDDEGQYQVEPLDPAQKGRFQVKVYVPSEPSKAYFAEKYDDHIAKAAIAWWQELPKEIRKLVDPRTLDQALDMHKIGGDIKDVLPKECNPSQLITTLRTGPIAERLKTLYKAQDADEARKFLAVENNYAAALPHFGDVKEWYAFFLPLLAPEKLSSLMSSDEKISHFVLTFCQQHPDKAQPYRKVIQEILQAGINRKLVKKIKKMLGANQLLASQFGYMTNVNAAPPHFNKRSPVKNWNSEVKQYATWPMQSTPHRISVYQAVAHNIPEQLTVQEAVDTLGLLNTLTARSWAKTLHNMPKLMGVVNHCIDQINKKTALSWPEILSNYGTTFDKLLAKINEAKLQDKLFCPNKGTTLTVPQGAAGLTMHDVVTQIVKQHPGITLKEITEEVGRLIASGQYKASMSNNIPQVVAQSVNSLTNSGSLKKKADVNGRVEYTA